MVAAVGKRPHLEGMVSVIPLFSAGFPAEGESV